METNLTYQPFAALDVALYGRSFDEMRTRRDQRERDARQARLDALKTRRHRAEILTFDVSETFRTVYPYLAVGKRTMPRRSVIAHRDNVREILSGRSLTLGQRNAARAMLRKLDALAA